MERMWYCVLVCALLFHWGEGIVQNCTVLPCNNGCGGSDPCQQSCYATPCQMSCTTTGGCDSKCPLGGCSKISCAIPSPASSECSQVCKENCGNMDCKAAICRPECKQDNCTMTCAGNNNNGSSQCYPKCFGKNCEINCKSTYCEASCEGGGCSVKFAKGTSGALSCTGNCTFICAKGSNCRYVRNCLGCSGPDLVDDPFGVATTTNPSTTKGNSAARRQFQEPFGLVFFAIIVALMQVRNMH